MSSKLTIECLDWRPLHRRTLQGFATIRVTEMQLSIKDVALHAKDTSRWAALPAKPILRDDAVVRDEVGKAQYIPVLEFDSRAVRDAFSSAVIKAVLERFPHAFDEEEAPT
jgi:hypothetical protein